MARVEGIEPPSTVLETVVLPLDHTPMEEAVGFEPTHAFYTPNCFQDSSLLSS